MGTHAHRNASLVWMTVVGLLLLCGCRTERLPQSMIGVWETSHERYRDCALRISANQLVFAHMGAAPKYCRINKIAIQSENEKKVVTFTYTNEEDGAFQSQWVFSPRHGGVIWHRSQPEIVWRPADMTE